MIALTHSKAYSLKFHNLTHSYFSTFGVLFAERDKRQDKSDREIMESYKWMCQYTLNFLNAYIKGDKKALEFLENNPEKNGLKSGLISKKTKEPLKSDFDIKDFNDLALKHEYKKLIELYRSTTSKHPDFELPEGVLKHTWFEPCF